MRHQWGILLALLLLSGSVTGQTLSDIVLPSEEEILEAFHNGDITYEQLVTLREVCAEGIDSTTLYLLDEIPNLIFVPGGRTPADPTESEQALLAEANNAPRNDKRSLSVDWRHRQCQALESEDEAWYRSRLDIAWRDKCRLRTQVERTQSGRERITYRSLCYRSRGGSIRQIEVGNFTTRIGLGTAYGYRGKLFDCTPKLNGKSLAYPDYGGYNGLLLEAQSSRFEFTGVASVNRDSTHRMTVSALSTTYGLGSLEPRLTLGLNRLVDRRNGERFDVIPISVGNRYEYSHGSLELEVTRQLGDVEEGWAGALEGRHRFAEAEVRFAGWTYSAGFVDLTAGGKAAPLYRTDTLSSVDFRYRTKRSGQSGGIVKTVVSLSEPLRWSNAVLIAEAPAGVDRREFSSTLDYSAGRHSDLALSFLSRTSTPSCTSESVRRESYRLEGRFRVCRCDFRCYIGFTSESDNERFSSLFVRMNSPESECFRWQVWSDWGEIDNVGLRYWYMFVRGDWQLYKQVWLGGKLSNGYRRNRDDHHRPQLTLELSASL